MFWSGILHRKLSCVAVKQVEGGKATVHIMAVVLKVMVAVGMMVGITVEKRIGMIVFPVLLAVAQAIAE